MTNASYNHNSLIRLYRTLAEAALTHYDIGKARVSLLSFGRNAVFRVDAISRQAIAATAPPAEEDEGEESGSGDDVEQQDLSPEPISYTTRKARYVLRLCDARTANEDMIRSEAQWLLAMSSGNDRPQSALPVPEPVAGRDGSYVLRIQIEGIDLTCLCLLLHWMPGRQIDSGLTPTLFERVGTLQARLHHHARYFTPPEDFIRPQQDWLSVLTAAPFDPTTPASALPSSFTSADRTLVVQAADYARAEIESLPKSSATYGLVHADFQQAHYLFQRGLVNAIGFDRCRYDYYLADSAVTLDAISKREDASSLFIAYWRGYTRIMPVSQQTVEEIELFLVALTLRRLGELLPKAYRSADWQHFLNIHRERLFRFVAARAVR